MRLWAALVALVVGCSEPVAVDVSSGLDPDGGAPPMQSDSGFEPVDAGGRDAHLAGFEGDTGVDAGAPVVVDAGTDAGPCYPVEGLENSTIQLDCDVCPTSGCLPIIWSGGTAGGTVSGEPGIVAATAVISAGLYAHRQTFDALDEAQAVVVQGGDFFEHLNQGQPITTGLELELDREPWNESGGGLPMPANTAVPSYMRIAAMVTPTGATFVWTMHRAPD